MESLRVPRLLLRWTRLWFPALVTDRLLAPAEKGEGGLKRASVPLGNKRTGGRKRVKLARLKGPLPKSFSPCPLRGKVTYHVV